LTHSLNHVRNFSQFARQLVWNVWDVLLGISCCSCTFLAVWVFFFKEMLYYVFLSDIALFRDMYLRMFATQ